MQWQQYTMMIFSIFALSIVLCRRRLRKNRGRSAALAGDLKLRSDKEEQFY